MINIKRRWVMRLGSRHCFGGSSYEFGIVDRKRELMLFRMASTMYYYYYHLQGNRIGQVWYIYAVLSMHRIDIFGRVV